MIYFIGIDDTDNEESRGTGRLSRLLAEHLGHACLGVTRHQFLVHPDIPYTSHNSGACMALDVAEEGIESLRRRAVEFMDRECAEGSDPGLCIARADQLGGEVLEYAREAQRIVLEMGRAAEIAEAAGISLTQHGGSGQGIIGALSACALRASGGDGRFIDLKGTRKLEGKVTVAELTAEGIDEVVCDGGKAPEGGDRVDTLGWVRPYLKNGRIILKVKYNNCRGDEGYEVDRSGRKKKDDG